MDNSHVEMQAPSPPPLPPRTFAYQQAAFDHSDGSTDDDGFYSRVAGMPFSWCPFHDLNVLLAERRI